MMELIISGKHYSSCIKRFPDCLCNSCAKDNADAETDPCCTMHGRTCDCEKSCPDYRKEARE